MNRVACIDTSQLPCGFTVCNLHSNEASKTLLGCYTTDDVSNCDEAELFIKIIEVKQNFSANSTWCCLKL
jgi:hypothetical protein